MNQAAHWTVPADHPAFAGHFPGAPIVPGVLLLEEALHVIATETGVNLHGCQINSVKFLSPARPGDALMIQHTRLARGAIQFEILVGTRKIASGQIMPSTAQ